jgi:hypothetical protein
LPEFRFKAPKGVMSASCHCVEWKTVTYRPCLELNAEGQCVRWGTETKVKCCARTSCGASEC